MGNPGLIAAAKLTGTFDTIIVPAGFEDWVRETNSQLTFSAIPEPGALGVLLAGGPALLSRRRRTS